MYLISFRMRDDVGRLAKRCWMVCKYATGIALDDFVPKGRVTG